MIDQSELYKTVLYTNRLTLRFPKRSDSADLFAFCRDERMCRYAEWYPHETELHSLSYIKYVIRNRRKSPEINFFIVHNESGRVIGTCSFVKTDFETLVGEIGYCVSADYWHHGYAAEAVSELIRFGFESLKFKRIQARVVTENIPSVDLLTRLGFVREGVMRNGATLKGETHDLYLYSMTDEEYYRKRGQINAGIDNPLHCG